MKNNRSAISPQSEKIAIISDSHDNLANIKKTFDFLKKEMVKTVLHCGDISTLLTLKEILNQFSGKIYIVFGNADKDNFEVTKMGVNSQSCLKVLGELGEIKINGKNIAFTHFPKLARELAESKKYDLVFYGHTHKPWEEKIGKTRLINPGNLAGIYYKATFATYDTKLNKLELKILD